MSSPSHDARLAPFLEALLECADPSRADELLLDLVDELQPAAACLLWRRLPGPADSMAWTPVRGRGDLEQLLPTSTQKAILEGTLGIDLLGAGTHLHAVCEPFGVAVIRTPGFEDETLEDLAAAALEVRLALGHAGEAPGPLPGA